MSKKRANVHEARRCLKERATPPGERSARHRGFARANVHEARRCLKERAAPPGERSARDRGFAKANVHEARRDLKERATSPEERSARHRGFAKANVHEARRDLKERATPPGERSARQLPSRGKGPAAFPKGTVAKGLTPTHTHTHTQRAAVPAKDNPFRVSRGRSAYGVPLGKGDLGGLKRFLWTVHNPYLKGRDDHHATS